MLHRHLAKYYIYFQTFSYFIYLFFMLLWLYSIFTQLTWGNCVNKICIWYKYTIHYIWIKSIQDICIALITFVCHEPIYLQEF